MTQNLTTKNILLTLVQNGVEYAAIPYVPNMAVVTSVSFAANNWELDTSDNLYKMTIGQYNAVVQVLNSSGKEVKFVDSVRNSSTGYITLQSLSAFAGSVACV